MSLVSRYFGRRPDCRRWRNSWSGYAVRLWPIWGFGVPSALIVLDDPSTMSVNARIIWSAVASTSGFEAGGCLDVFMCRRS